VTVLFSILFQSLHTYEHFKAIASTECHHKYSHGEPEITHQHHNFDDCKVCHFTFGSYVSPEVFAYSLKTITNKRPISLRRETFRFLAVCILFGVRLQLFKLQLFSNQSLLCLVGMFHF
jgi:hypothetical protein